MEETSKEELISGQSNSDKEEVISNSSKKNPRLRKLSSTDVEDESLEETIVSLKFVADFKLCSEILEDPTIVLDNNEEMVEFKVDALTDKKNYTWKVYHTKQEVKSNIDAIQKYLKNQKGYPSTEDEKKEKENFDMLAEKIKVLDLNQIKNNISNVLEFYKKCFDSTLVQKAQIYKEFFGISNLSFNKMNKIKPMEGYAEKKSDPRCCRKAFGYICPCLECLFFRQWNKRWIILKDEMIDYSNSSIVDYEKNVYFLDSHFHLSDVTSDRRAIRIADASRTLILRFKSQFEKALWKKEIKKRMANSEELLKENAYGSFSTPKIMNVCKWFADGQDYFNDLHSNLQRATYSVFITDWWLSPECFLKRPVNMTTYEDLAKKKINRKDLPQSSSRVMDILYQLADRGVKIYIMVYGEFEMALTLNSKHTKNSLEKLHKNIQVIRHPYEILLWSHHEKLVVIDQKIGYVGGIDLCWGRYDTHDHPIVEPRNMNNTYSFPGIDYSNARIFDFAEVDNYLKENVDRRKLPRMPWHDVHMRVEGPVVPDIARHFVQRWNDVRRESQRTALGYVQANKEATLTKLNKNATITEDTLKEPKKLQLKENSWFGNIIKKASLGIDENVAKQIDEEINEEEKKEDNALLKEEEKKEVIVNDEPKNEEEKKESLIQEEDNNLNSKIMFKSQIVEGSTQENEEISKNLSLNPNAKQEKLNQQFMRGKTFIDKDHYLIKDEVYKNPNSKFYSRFINSVGQSSQEEKKEWYSGMEEILSPSILRGEVAKGRKAFCQVLRSGSKWSIGIKETEHSIKNAYYKLIDESEHFIYIENQFFVSRSFDEKEDKEELKKKKDKISLVVENQIAYHIRKRVEKAILNNENFKVIIFIPLLPGFAGEIEDSGTLQLIVKHTYAGISHNHGLSIIEKCTELLKSLGRSPTEISNYINFYSLRGHGMIGDNPVTELIYIHSKLLIVDDRTVLIGSANINDRSQLGDRDSEFAIIVQEKNTLKSKMNGEDYKAAHFAAEFRRALMAEHMGLPADHPMLEDPVNLQLIRELNGRANSNTLMYRTIFGCYPDDEYDSLNALRNRKILSGEDLKKTYLENKDAILGHVVRFPLDFLAKDMDQLGLKVLSAENILPEYNYT